MNTNLYIRLGLLVGMFSISVHVVASHSTHYSKATAKVSPTGVGKVYVSTSNATPTDGQYESEPSATQECGGNSNNDSHKYYFWAKTIDNAYLFDKWSDGSTEQSAYSKSVTAKSESNADPTLLTLTAYWVQPKVTGVSNVDLLPPVTNPNDTRNGNVVFTLTDDRNADNFTHNKEDINGKNGFVFSAETYASESYTFPVAYTATGVHGTHSTQLTLTSNYGGSTRTATVSVTEDYTPYFTAASPAFADTEAGSATAPQSVTPVSTVYASSSSAGPKWSAALTGGDIDAFALESCDAENGQCNIIFSPEAVQTYSATLTITCTYTDAEGNDIEHSKSISLQGTGTGITTPQITISNNSSNPGAYNSSTNTYTYQEQYGTVTHSAAFALNYALLQTKPALTLSGDDVFQFSQGEVTTNAIGLSTLPVTITAHADNAVSAPATYTATLTISGTTTSNTPIAKTLTLSVTIHPKKANTLAWALDVYNNTSSYVLYTDQANHPAFKDRNNTTTPIVFSSSQKDLANYIQIDTAACTLSPKLAANSRNLKATQAESDEYEGTTLTTTIHVRKHDLVWTYPQTDWARGTGLRLYRNTYYANILSTNSIDAGEATGFSEFRYNGTEPALGQKLIDHGNGTYGIETGDLTGNLPFVVNIPETENYSGRANTTGTAVTFSIIKDPIHVPVSLGSVTKFTSGAHKDEWYGLWLNNGNDMYGSTFKVSEYKATWIGYDWVSGKWTGTNTGRTDWTIGGNGYGSTNAFALEDGGYVVFRFRGIPMYTSFTIHSQTSANNAALDGTVKIEESKDGITWTETTQNSTSATYLSTAGGKGVWMKGESQYIRFSYTGSNHVVIRDVSISENNYIRTDFTTNNQDKAHICTTANNELTKNADGTWKSFDFTLRVANWGKNGIQWTTDNPDFELAFTQPTGTGLDEYKEIPAKVRYKGDKYFDRGTLKIFTRDFYSKTATDTLRSLTFTVKAIGTGVSMPQTITNSNKTTTYITGTVGPLRNSKTDLHESGYLYSAARGDNPHTGLNEQDFSSCFGEDGTALFDKLYIFGETTNNDGTTERYTYWYVTDDDTLSTTGTFPKISAASGNAASNAVTPCYVYTKSGNGYTLTQTIDNMNVATKPIGTITTGGKYYFSGHCPSASAGYSKSDMGVLHFKGSNTTDIQIYLENCSIIPRAKSETGISTPNLIEYKATSLLGYTAVEGSGGCIVLESTSNTAFAPQIHIKGENYLKSNLGCMYSAVLSGKTVAGPGNQSAAPIHIYSTSDKTKATLVIDDLWPTGNTSMHVNGELRLRKLTNQSPSIDLGNSNSIIYFNGGRISLHNAFPVSQSYVTTQAISCRKFVKEVSILTATLYGVGGDYDGGEVHFNDGTISVLPMDVSSNATYAAYYRDGISIKCPSKTYVDGGTYISSIWACTDPTSTGASPTNQWGDAVVSHLLPVDNVDTQTGLATVSFPSDLKNEDETDTYVGETLEAYYVRKGKDYGRASLAPNDSNYVQLMLPAKYTGKDVIEEETIIPWFFSSTEIKVGANGYSQSIGGDKSVAPNNERTNYFIWTQIDNNIRTAGTNSSYKTPVLEGSGGIQVEASVEKIGEEDYANVANTGDYSIDNKLYLMRAIEADTWFSMVAPFDISHIYVMDTYPYSVLKNKSRSEALHLQGEANLDLAYFIAAAIEGTGNATQDLDAFVSTFLRYGYGKDTTSGIYPRSANTIKVNGNPVDYYPTYYASAKGYTTDYRGQNELIHYCGTNASTANYYLYHSKAKTWEWQPENNRFKTDWELVQPDSVTIDGKKQLILMKQGEIYALQFPYCPGCDEVNQRSYFDYWTGKLILFEGYGPQTLKGTDMQSEQLEEQNGTIQNQGVLRGNMTLGDMNAASLPSIFIQTEGRNIFEAVTDNMNKQISPMGVFLLANPDIRSVAKITSIHVKSGEVTYSDEDEAETPTGMPTIAGGHTLLVSSQHEELVITALRPQQVYVYSATGQLLASQWLTEEMHLFVPQGMYLVRGEKDEAKVLVQ